VFPCFIHKNYFLKFENNFKEINILFTKQKSESFFVERKSSNIPKFWIKKFIIKIRIMPNTPVRLSDMWKSLDIRIRYPNRKFPDIRGFGYPDPTTLFTSTNSKNNGEIKLNFLKIF